MNYKNKNILVTGATKGLGKEISIEFEKLGANLALVGRSEDNLNKIFDTFKDKQKHIVINDDLLSKDGLDKTIKNVSEKFLKLDVIIHCLGGSFGINDPLDSWENFEKSFRGNLGVAVDINRKFIPKMIETGSGNIIHVSSIVSQQSTASPFYSAAKSAVNGYVRGMGNYLAKSKVYLSGIVPGAFIGDLNAMGRFKHFKPDEYKEFVDKLPQKEMPHAKEYLEIIKILGDKEKARIFAGSLINLDSAQGLIIESLSFKYLNQLFVAFLILFGVHKGAFFQSSILSIIIFIPFSILIFGLHLVFFFYLSYICIRYIRLTRSLWNLNDFSF